APMDVRLAVAAKDIDEGLRRDEIAGAGEDGPVAFMLEMTIEGELAAQRAGAVDIGQVVVGHDADDPGLVDLPVGADIDAGKPAIRIDIQGCAATQVKAGAEIVIGPAIAGLHADIEAGPVEIRGED